MLQSLRRNQLTRLARPKSTRDPGLDPAPVKIVTAQRQIRGSAWTDPLDKRAITAIDRIDPELSGDPAKRARAIVEATTHFEDAEIIARVSRNLGEAMVGINIADIPASERMQERGW